MSRAAHARRLAHAQLRLVLGIILAVLLLAGAAVARPAVTPEDFVATLGSQVMAVLPEPGRADPARALALRRLLRDHVDLAGIGQRALGQPWRTADAEERAAFLALFEDLVVETYGRRLADYAAARLEILGARFDGAGVAVVRSRLAPRWGRAIAIDWRLTVAGERWRVADIVLEGLSVTVLHRNDFVQLHRMGGMAGLLDSLRARATTAALAP